MQWQAINLTTTELTIQVNFTDPTLISPKIVRDYETHLFRAKKIRLK